MKTIRFALIAAVAMLAVPSLSLAQDKPVDAKGDGGTVTLNRESAAASAAQNAANAASAAQYQANVAGYQEDRAATAQARADYDAAVARHRQLQAEYDAAYARWQADVAACNAGDVSHCDHSAPRR